MTRAVRLAVMALLSTVMFALPAGATGFVFPIQNQDGFVNDGPPPVTASSWIVYDELTDTVLAELNADTPRPMASITKIMTVLLALERGSLDDQVTISMEAAATGGQEIGLVAGETVSLGALVRAALIRSGNDAAVAIAEHIGGSVEGFVRMMNERAAELGMENTNFVNPHGLDATGHFSSPRDMLIVARQAMSMPDFVEVSKARMLVFPDTPGGAHRAASNTNRILNTYEGAIGVKTGETPRAGLTYVGAAERDGRRVFAVVFNSIGQRAHLADAVTLFDWTFLDLSIHGTLYAGIPFRPSSPRVEPPPLLVEAAAEAFVHTAAQGLAADPPSPPGDEPIPDPPPVIDTTRHPNPAPRSLLSAFTFWLGLMTGSGDG